MSIIRRHPEVVATFLVCPNCKGDVWKVCDNFSIMCVHCKTVFEFKPKASMYNWKRKLDKI